MADPSELSDEEILAKIKKDPATRELAENLGMSVDDYAQKVLFYVRNPQAQPQIEVMSDEEAREAGMPSVAECVSFLGAVVNEEAKKEEAIFAGFDEDDEHSAVTGSLSRKRAPKIGEAKGAVKVADESTDVGRQLKEQAAHAKRMAMQDRRKPSKKSER
jgi:predicted lipoprotein